MVSKESEGLIFIKRLNAKVTRIRNNLLELLWVRFSLTLLRKIGNDDVSNMAAGIAYYTFLSIFPLLLGLVAIMGSIFPSESVVKQLISFFSQFLPGVTDILQSSLPDLLRFRAALGAVGVIGLLWSATGVFSATTNAVNRAWDIRYNHPFYIKKPKELLMVLGTGFLCLLSFGTSTFLSMLGNLQLPITGLLVSIGTAVVAFIFSALVFLLVNKLTPALWVSWRNVWPGAVISTVFFEIAKTLFIFYTSASHNYDKVYGSIASIIILLVWIYYSAFILLVGAEFNSTLHKMKREGESFDKSADRTDLLREV